MKTQDHIEELVGSIVLHYGESSPQLAEVQFLMECRGRKMNDAAVVDYLESIYNDGTMWNKFRDISEL